MKHKPNNVWAYARTINKRRDLVVPTENENFVLKHNPRAAHIRPFHCIDYAMETKFYHYELQKKKIAKNRKSERKFKARKTDA